MIKNLLSALVLVSASLMVQAQTITATYSFAATTSVTGTTDPTPPPTATGVTFGSFTAVGTSTANGSTGRFSFNGWPIATLSGSTSATSYSAMGGSIDLGKYYEVSISPTSGFAVTLDSITFLSRRTGTGPRSFSVRSSADSYSNNLLASVPPSTLLSIAGTNEFFYTVDAATSSAYNSGNKITTSNAAFTGFTNPITFRFYAWNAEAAAGNFGIDDVTFYGSVALSTRIGNLNYNLNSNFNVYPVPSHDGILFIESKNMQDVNKIEVLDILGNIVLSNTSKTETKVKLNLADMPSGNYFVRVYSGNVVSTKKIVVIK
ncbi:MAG: T9SS type A sorting domain-containing protein [Bacteroidota bacterium]